MQKIKENLKENRYDCEDLVLLCGDLNVDCNEVPYELSKESCLKKLPKAVEDK